MGRDWRQKIQLNLNAICHVDKSKLPSFEDDLQSHAVVFSKEIGVAKNIVAKIHLDPEATPTFYPRRSVPYAIKSKIEQELHWGMKAWFQRSSGQGNLSGLSTCDEGRWLSHIMRRLQGHHKSGHQIRFIPAATN